MCSWASSSTPACAWQACSRAFAVAQGPCHRPAWTLQFEGGRECWCVCTINKDCILNPQAAPVHCDQSIPLPHPNRRPRRQRE